MTFSGFLILFDPPKPYIIEKISSLKKLGVALKIITGDNRLVAAHVSQQMGLSDKNVLTGSDISLLSDAALLKQVGSVEVFAEIEPNQKERPPTTSLMKPGISTPPKKSTSSPLRGNA